MLKHTRLLLVSIMTFIGLAAVVTPAHADAVVTPAQAEVAGVTYVDRGFGGGIFQLTDSADCVSIPNGARSAKNTSRFSTIKLYTTRIVFTNVCFGEVADLRPGQSDNGYVRGTEGLSELGEKGASYYTAT